MAKFEYAALETNEENDDGVAVTLYFSGSEPTKDEVAAACKNAGLQLSVDPNDEFFEFFVCPNLVSQRANLHRVQCHPTC